MQHSLMTRIKTVKEKALATKVLNRQQEEIKQMKGFIQNLIDLENAVEDLDKAYEAVRSISGLSMTINHDSIIDLDRGFKEVTRTIEKPAVEWTVNNANVKRLTKTSREYETAISDDWKAYCEECVKGNAAIVDTLGRIFGDRESSRVKELVAAKQKIKSSVPLNAAAVQKQILIYNKKCQELLNCLDLNERIVDFLRRLTTDGQHLSLFDVDEEILTWLKDNHFAQKLEIRFA